MKIILAQGNPDKKYKKTRHNVGFMSLNTMVEQYKVKWIEQVKFHALVAEIQIAGEKILLVKPTTYYNDTGISARAIMDYYKLTPSKDLLILHDDIAIPFGKIRVRNHGQDGGNNGVKSLNAYIGQDYKRIRIGTYNENRDRVDDANFVLSKFSLSEQHTLKKVIIPKTIELINDFTKNKLELASYTLI